MASQNRNTEMPVEFKEWDYSPEQQERFLAWVKAIYAGHTGTADVRSEPVNWAPPKKPLDQCKVALVTTGGVHLRSQKPFDILNHHGDWSYREFPKDVDARDLMVTHGHYNHGDSDVDINCMLPIERLRELQDEAFIGDIAPNIYTFMGFVTNPRELVEGTGLEVARRLKEEGTDVAFLTGG